MDVGVEEGEGEIGEGIRGGLGVIGEGGGGEFEVEEKGCVGGGRG